MLMRATPLFERAYAATFIRTQPPDVAMPLTCYILPPYLFLHHAMPRRHVDAEHMLICRCC